MKEFHNFGRSHIRNVKEKSKEDFSVAKVATSLPQATLVTTCSTPGPSDSDSASTRSCMEHAPGKPLPWSSHPSSSGSFLFRHVLDQFLVILFHFLVVEGIVAKVFNRRISSSCSPLCDHGKSSHPTPSGAAAESKTSFNTLSGSWGNS